MRVATWRACIPGCDAEEAKRVRRLAEELLRGTPRIVGVASGNGPERGWVDPSGAANVPSASVARGRRRIIRFAREG